LIGIRLSKTLEQALPPQPLVARFPFYYGWVNMVFAAIAMVATLPARSVGIGLITEPLLQDLNLQRVSFGQMTFWAKLWQGLLLVCFAGLLSTVLGYVL